MQSCIAIYSNIAKQSVGSGQAFAKADATSLVSGLFCRHQTQVGGGADLSWVDKASFLERRKVLLDCHEMGGSMAGGRGRVDVIADQNSSAGNEQAVELSYRANSHDEKAYRTPTVI